MWAEYIEHFSIIWNYKIVHFCPYTIGYLKQRNHYLSLLSSWYFSNERPLFLPFIWHDKKTHFFFYFCVIWVGYLDTSQTKVFLFLSIMSQLVLGNSLKCAPSVLYLQMRFFFNSHVWILKPTNWECKIEIKPGCG